MLPNSSLPVMLQCFIFVRITGSGSYAHPSSHPIFIPFPAECDHWPYSLSVCGAWQAGRRSLYASSSSSVWGENWKEFDILSGESAWRPWGDSHWSECWHCLEPSRLPWILNLHSKSFPIIRSSAQEITGRGVVYHVLQRIKVKSQKWPMKLSVTKYSMIWYDCTSDTSHPHGRHWLINKWFWLAINIDE